MHFTEDMFEQAVIELFENMGYTHIYAPDMDRDYSSPLLDAVLMDSLVKLNKGLPLDAITEAVNKLRNFDTGSLMQKNMQFMDYLQNGVPVKFFVKGEERSSIVYLILEYFSKEHPTINVRASQIPWALDDGIGTMLPVMQSDITLSYGSKVLIIDAKYYAHTTQVQYDKHTLHSNNLYQIFTYVKNKDFEFGDKLHEVSGMLLYAQTDEAIQPDNTYMMSGNRISVKTLDLNCDFGDIAAQLNTIADTLLR